MKGAIVKALEETIEERHGEETWETVLETAGVSDDLSFVLASSDVDDDVVVDLFEATAETLDVSMQAVADEFGSHWVTEFAPEMYGAYFKDPDSAREMLERMDDVHDKVTRRIDNANPPDFEIQERDDDSVVMEYDSDRDLVEIMLGAARGVGEYYGEDVDVRRLGSDRARIDFE